LYLVQFELFVVSYVTESCVSVFVRFRALACMVDKGLRQRSSCGTGT
jgi:hypothetical protein